MSRDPSIVAAWVRAVQLLDRQVVRAYRLHEAVRDEVLFAFVHPDRRTAVTASGYGKHKTIYSSGGHLFERGLVDWEIRSLSIMGATRGSSVLVGGVGGGRELGGLSDLGCRVVALEPSKALAEAAQSAADSLPDVRVFEASYEDFVEAEATRAGPLVPLLGPHDAIVLGRGSFGHLTDEAQQLALLSALRRSSPRACVLIGFMTRRADQDSSDTARVRSALRRLFAHLGGESVPSGLRYDTRRGFIYWFTRDEIERLAASSGYRVRVFETSAYALPRGPAHAILEPR